MSSNKGPQSTEGGQKVSIYKNGSANFILQTLPVLLHIKYYMQAGRDSRDNIPCKVLSVLSHSIPPEYQYNY